MRSFRRALFTMASVLCLVLSVIVLAVPASATSAYDNVVTPIDSLVIGSPCTRDLSATWSSELRSHLGGADLASFDNRVAWSVTYAHGSEGPGSEVIYISWWEAEAPATASFSAIPGALMASAPSGAGLLYVDPNDCSVGGWALTPGFLAYVGATRPGPGPEDINGWLRPFELVGVNVDYPSGYEGALVPGSYAPKYVAMGDSFSSGEGNEPFEYGTATDGVNECHRSQQAYPRLLQDELSFERAAFVACSGATTSSVLSGGSAAGSWGEGSQTSLLSPETELVTLTLGGNDIKFGAFAGACVTSSCGETSTAYGESYDVMTDATRSDYLPDALSDVYTEIATKLTPANTDAKVLVVGYPHVVTYQGYLTNVAITPSNCVYLGGGEAAAIESIVDELNDTIQTAVATFGDSRFKFVDPNFTLLPPKPTDTELCSTQSHFNGVDLVNQEYSFHPNAAGQEDYALLIKSFLN